jgi:hypothetical protein
LGFDGGVRFARVFGGLDGGAGGGRGGETEGLEAAGARGGGGGVGCVGGDPLWDQVGSVLAVRGPGLWVVEPWE